MSDILQNLEALVVDSTRFNESTGLTALARDTKTLPLTDDLRRLVVNSYTVLEEAAQEIRRLRFKALGNEVRADQLEIKLEKAEAENKRLRAERDKLQQELDGVLGMIGDDPGEEVE